MTRTAIGGIAAGAFTLGILAGLVLPGSPAATHHDQLMASHMSAMNSMPMGNMNSMPMGNMSSMPMMETDAMPMASGSGSSGHEAHHALPEVGR